MSRILIGLFSAFLVSACAVGPNYKRPTVPVPSQFRGAGPDQPADPASLADLKWFDLFKDDGLKQLVGTDLEQKFILPIAAERVLQARALLGVSRSDQFPTLDLTGDFVASRGSSVGAVPFIPRHEPRRQLYAGRLSPGLGTRRLGTAPAPDRSCARRISS